MLILKKMRRPAFVVVAILASSAIYTSFKVISPIDRKHAQDNLSYMDFESMKYEDKIKHLSVKMVKVFDGDIVQDKERLVKEQLFSKKEDELTKNELLVKANIYSDMGKHNEALSLYSLAMNKYDPKPVHHLNKAMVLYRLGKIDRSIDEIDKAITIDTNYANSYLIKCVLYDKIKRYDDAISFCNYALKLDKTIGDAHYQKGNIYMEIESYDEAVKEYKAAVFASPQKVKTYEKARNDAMRKFLAYRSGKFDIKE